MPPHLLLQLYHLQVSHVLQVIPMYRCYKLLKLRSTFAPYSADGESGSDGDPQVTVQEIRDSLKELLADLDKELG